MSRGQFWIVLAGLLLVPATSVKAFYTDPVLGWNHRPDTTAPGTIANGTAEPNTLAPGDGNVVNGQYWSAKVVTNHTTPNTTFDPNDSFSNAGFYQYTELGSTWAGVTQDIDVWLRNYSQDEDGDTVAPGYTVKMEAFLWGDNIADDTMTGQFFIRFLNGSGGLISEATKVLDSPITTSVGIPSDGPLSAVAPAGTASYDYGVRVHILHGGDGNTSFRMSNFITDIQVPEPASTAILGLSVLGLLARRSRG